MALSAAPLAAAALPLATEEHTTLPTGVIIDRATQLDIDINRAGDCSLGIGRSILADDDFAEASDYDSQQSEIAQLTSKLLADFASRPSLPNNPGDGDHDAPLSGGEITDLLTPLSDDEIIARATKFSITIYRDTHLSGQIDVGLGIANIRDLGARDDALHTIRELIAAFGRKPNTWHPHAENDNRYTVV